MIQYLTRTYGKILTVLPVSLSTAENHAAKKTRATDAAEDAIGRNAFRQLFLDLTDHKRVALPYGRMFVRWNQDAV